MTAPEITNAASHERGLRRANASRKSRPRAIRSAIARTTADETRAEIEDAHL